MKTAILVTWCCVTVLLFGVVAVLHHQRTYRPITSEPIRLCPDEQQVYSLNDGECHDRADFEEVDPSHTEGGIVWIVNQEPQSRICTTGLDPDAVECRRRAAREEIEWAMEGQTPQVSRLEALKITSESFEAMLRDYPDAKLRIVLEPSRCEEQMEAAMRVVDAHLHPTISSESYDGCNYCGDGTCTAMACEYGTARDLRQLEWEVAQAKKQIEREKQRSEAWKLWDVVKKECWRQP